MNDDDIHKRITALEQKLAELEREKQEQKELDRELLRDAINETSNHADGLTHRDFVAARARQLLSEGRFAELEEFLRTYRSRLK